MTLHVFNPEHDIALAANLENFTSPHAGRQLRHDIGFLPALWAGEGDRVLTDDAEAAAQSLHRLAVQARKHLRLQIIPRATFIAGEGTLAAADRVEPWGWDLALRAQLRRRGIADSVMPTDTLLADIRALSHRRTAARLMQLLLDDGLDGIIGDIPAECQTAEEVEAALQRYGRAVIKAPWSSSGRGIRFIGTSKDAPLQGQNITLPPTTNAPLQGQNIILPSPPRVGLGVGLGTGILPWLRGVLARQGSVMVEPYYNKVKDLGMEFEALPDGSVRYCGLSLFHTANGQYTGNILATEQAKREMAGRYIPLTVLDNVRERICHHLPTLLQGHYQGPLGVDMMVCNSPTSHSSPLTSHPPFLHPCVEINLRRTMGHAALSLTPADDDLVGVMRIEYRNDKSKADITVSALPVLLSSAN